jgi:hypothetical protein
MDAAELRQTRRSLKIIGLEAGSPFTKARRTVVPIYGREKVLRFLTEIGVPAGDLPEILHSSTNT